MKKSIIVLFSLNLAGTVQAREVKSNPQLTLRPSEISAVIPLVNKVDDTGLQKRLQIVVQDQGMSTDVSPRYKVFLSYASLAEMGNLTADFELSANVFEFLSATRTAPGLYTIKFKELRNGKMLEVTQEVNALQLFIKEKETRTNCGDNFCDLTIKSKILVQESIN